MDPTLDFGLDVDIDIDVPAGASGASGPTAAEGGSPASPSASPAPPGQRTPAKISCLACRAAKRKCLTPNVHTTCKRCVAHELVCEYKKHRRGRVKKSMAGEGVGAGAMTGTATGQSQGQDPSTSMSLSGGANVGVGVGIGTHDQPTTAHSVGASASSVQSYLAEGSRNAQAGSFPLSGMVVGGVSQQQDVLGENGGMEMPGGDLAPLPPRASRPSRVDISFSHVIPGEGDSSPFLPIAAEAARQTAAGDLEQLLREDCPDPVTAGLLSEADAFELFEFYFRHLNITVAILDPVLHTPSFCRDRSTLLFTAVLTVTAKIVRPKAYSHCLMLSNKLVGQAVEYGLCSIEIVQAIILLTHWKKADDTTAWRRAGYAIRMAQELKLNVKRARPLPKNERQAREVLNTERTWLNLIISDYHLAIHHSLPRMIAEEGINDPADWVQEHPHITCPGEAALAPRIQFGRMCRLYADMLAGMSGDEANLRMLEWLELEWKRWRSKWLLENHGFEFTAQQVSTTKMDDAFFRFHIAEYRLLYTARYHSQGRALDASEPTPLSFAFSECVDAALGVPAMFQNEFVRHRYLPYCFVRVWVALAVTSVWLVKNIVAMRPTDRSRVIRTLSEVQSSTEEASRSSDDMSAYTHRLLKHLLSGISPEWQFSSLVPTQRTGQTLVTSSANPNPNPNPIPSSISSVNGSGSGSGSGSQAHAQVQHQSSATWAATSAQEIIQDHLWNQHDPKFSFGTMSSTFQNATFPVDPDTIAGMQPQPNTHSDDVLFPAADDEFWRLFFPTTDGPAAV